MELYRTRLYSIYAGMKQRCYNPKSSHFEYYGEKGVKICDEWLNGTDGLQNFMEWALAHGYNEELTIDRIDPAGDYSPDNCRWLTVQENAGRANRGRGGPPPKMGPIGVIRYRIDILEALKAAGWSTYRLGAKGEKIIGERTIQALRQKKPVSFEILARVCDLLGCQPGDLLEYVEDDGQTEEGGAEA